MPDKSRDTNTALSYLDRTYAAEDVVEMGKHVESLVEHPGWQIVTDLLAKQREDTQAVLDNGLHEHVVYAQQHGLLRGQRAAEAIASGVIEAGRRADAQLQAFIQQQTAEENE